ncbi:ATP-binding cassette domain-containing protein [Pseudooceanicola sp. C21-150M6]|uniref:ATP-binding cassette domain-containing protein n=1 Tax=Pseudooceanicola sp. C21-150M6 TaxID=3434355 RepID=UPI003D7F6EA5
MSLLSITGLHRHYGGVRAVDGVDMSLDAGELACIIGPNGAGKSTLMGLLSGAMPPTGGTVRFAGQEMTGRRTHEFARAGILRKFQGGNVFQWMSVRDNLLTAGMETAAVHGRAMPDPDEVLETIKLVPQAELNATGLSHGQRQWLEVGMILMCAPRLLLLDEPAAGMTAVGTSDMADLILRLRARHAIIVIEHDMGFVERLGCRTLVMHQGRVIGEGAYDDLRRDETVRDVYLGRALADAAD